MANAGVCIRGAQRFSLNQPSPAEPFAQPDAPEAASFFAGLGAGAPVSSIPLEPISVSIEEQWEQLLTPAVMHERLISASLYVMAFELLKESIIGRIRSFYSIGFDPNGEIVDEKYERTVLSRNKSPLYASLDWLTEHGVIDQADLQLFEQIKSTRNSLAHELPYLVLNGKEFGHIERFQDLIGLLRKIDVWWIVNLEIATDPAFDGKEIDETQIAPGSILMIQMMLDVLSGNEELLKRFRKETGIGEPGL